MLLLLEERLLEPELLRLPDDLLLLPRALGLLLDDLLLDDLLPLEAEPRLLLLREGLDLDEEEELRDAIACSLGG